MSVETKETKEQRNLLVEQNGQRFKRIKKLITKHKLKKLEEHKAFYEAKLPFINEVEELQFQFIECEKEISKLDQLLGLPSDIQEYIKSKLKDEEEKKKLKDEEEKKKLKDEQEKTD